MQRNQNHFCTLLIALAAITLLAGMLTASAAEKATGTRFDHFATGFPLNGAHAQAECQTCHLQGVFKGTPRQCEVCHAQGSRIASTFKPINHPRTVMPCSQCHNSQTTWTGARYDHVGVAPGSCATCHNGVTATGMPTSGAHPTTTASCDKCHRTTAWLPASFDHTRVSQGRCATCHNGTTAMGMNTGHIPITSVQTGWSCDACHSYTAFTFAYSTFTHTTTQGVTAGQCATCHNGSYTASNAQGMKSTGYNHFTPITGLNTSCDTCHGSYSSFSSYKAGASHNGVVSGNNQCYGCHDGAHTIHGVCLGRPNDHDPVTNCDACHQMTSWGAGGNRAPLPTPLRIPLQGRVPLPKK